MDNRLLRSAAACAAFAVCSVPSAQNNAEPAAIVWEADFWSLDLNTNLTRFEGLRLTYGDIAVQADEAVATGLTLGSEWRFNGGVQISIAAALLEADRVTFTFGERELTLAEFHGNPVLFTDMSPERAQAARGGAGSVVYDYAEQQLRFSDNAWFSVGRNEIRGCDLVYDFERGQVMSGSASCSERFSITIDPPADDPASGTDRSP